MAISIGLRHVLRLNNPTIAALTYLLVVLVAATGARLWVAVVASILAVVCLNYFFMPPVGTFTIADPQNWVALFAFLAITIIVSKLSSSARSAELARQSEELKSALLASLGHDLRTPLTAIRVAASNLRASWLGETERQEQSDLVLAEVERLSRLFVNILEMARIDAGALSPEVRWVHPSEILEAARDQVEHTLRRRHIDVNAESERLVHLDPRLTASALAHLLENAAQYAPPESPIAVTMDVSPEGLTISVRDHGPGIASADLSHVFDRFYRGAEAGRRVSGTGMGLSIARGMLAVERGRIWVENCVDGGARFTIAVPAASKPTTSDSPA